MPSWVGSVVWLGSTLLIVVSPWWIDVFCCRVMKQNLRFVLGDRWKVFRWMAGGVWVQRDSSESWWRYASQKQAKEDLPSIKITKIEDYRPDKEQAIEMLS